MGNGQSSPKSEAHNHAEKELANQIKLEKSWANQVKELKGEISRENDKDKKKIIEKKLHKATEHEKDAKHEVEKWRRVLG